MNDNRRSQVRRLAKSRWTFRNGGRERNIGTGICGVEAATRRPVSIASCYHFAIQEESVGPHSFNGQTVMVLDGNKNFRRASI
jgi:hypothetical protein